MFSALASAGVNIAIISTSDIRITCVVPRERVEDAVRILHSTFELDRKD
jgi:aspartate kinase